tara:strand:- start:2206 stop:2409 length:204 start_codon:yes stop_codon:yes gene_type:complete
MIESRRGGLAKLNGAICWLKEQNAEKEMKRRAVSSMAATVGDIRRAAESAGQFYAIYPDLEGEQSDG